jgi:hypothetical protein
MQNIIVNTIGITPIINSITTMSSNIFGLLANIKITKNIHYDEIMTMLYRTDIEATIILLQNIISDISGLPDKEYFSNNNFILTALQNVKEGISGIETELTDIKEKMNYNSTLYLMSNMRSYDLLPNLQRIETKISVLDRRCEYLFKSLDLCKHFTIKL